MNRSEQVAFRRDVRTGLVAEAERKYRAKLSEIDAWLSRQRSECGQELAQVTERLDRALERERLAAKEMREAARDRLAAAREERKAKRTRKRLSCKTEAGRERHAACVEELGELTAKLDRALERERLAAKEMREAARDRLGVARKERGAKRAQKRKACAAEAAAIRAQKKAEQAHKAELRKIDAQIRRREKKENQRTSRAERRSETRGEVEANLSPNLVPLWRKMRGFKVPKRSIGRMTLTEAFEHYASEHPEEVFAAQEGDIEKEARKRERGLRGKRSRFVSDEVPF